MKALVLAKNYIKYLLKAKNEHSLHSPFVYDFYTKAVVKKTPKPILKKIEGIRDKLLKTDETVNFTDYGAGSHLIKNEKRYIKNITRICSKSKKEGRLLHNIIEYFQPTTILELGTSVGISSMYLATANQNAKIITLEGVEDIAKTANNGFNTLGLNNIEVMVGEFSTTLDTAISKLNKLDFVYIDGNHKKKPTLEYFEKCLPNTHNDSIVVFDDIHWTRDMEEAWEAVCAHKETTLCLDFFNFGIAFLKKELSKETFILKY